MSRVVFLLIPQVHLLDVAGPAQVFSTAADLGYGHTISYVSEEKDVATVQGLPLRADDAWPDLGTDDFVIVPGWRGPTRAVSTATIDRLRGHHAAGGTVAGVCAGVDALGRAGLLNGRRCTTHHTVQDELSRLYPEAVVVRDVLYVADDRVVTSAGVASGIDVALHLLRTRHGPRAAGQVARTMVVYAHRNGQAHQVSVMFRHRSHVDETVHRIQDLIDARFTERLPLGLLAETVGCSERTVTRLFRTATGTTPLGYQTALRLERAEHLIGQGSTTEAAAREIGFEDARMLRRLRAREQAGKPRSPVRR
ncbi:GlxA family transcriptional regulator [Streptosporangium sp. 'caverna']|uniref:GlxA family transcriptional regulator n=1 Tax=Streptosporangium sp. 'caverna' TaxID=2202249 RepID=UPI000D7DCAD3|nr:DJ-1/PfpI family protein [Streptosporangium sp. 'caverna']AWS42936.1 AraC family transcriptional regulator [Streptosporangium sp. 'caverna']